MDGYPSECYDCYKNWGAKSLPLMKSCFPFSRPREPLLNTKTLFHHFLGKPVSPSVRIGATEEISFFECTSGRGSSKRYDISTHFLFKRKLSLGFMPKYT